MGLQIFKLQSPSADPRLASNIDEAPRWLDIRLRKKKKNLSEVKKRKKKSEKLVEK